MATVKVIRLEQTPDGALGSLLIDGRLFCTTLEPDAGDPVKHQIPAGTYQCRRFHGVKWPDTYEIIVLGHTAVLFHAGNVEDNSQMCVLLGQYPGKLRGKRAVLNSGLTFQTFLTEMRVKYPEGFDAHFIDFY